MGRELGFNLRGRTECRIVQDIKIFLHSTRGFVWINGAAIPIFFRCGVLFVRISLDQAGICGQALTAHQTICDAAGNGLLKQMPE